VFPISAAVAEEFARVARSVKVPVGSSGTGGGFQKFCRGDIDFADASRPINQTERDACAKEGIVAEDIVEIQVAIDALTVVVNRENTWAHCMTTAQLTNAFRNGGAGKWSDLDPSWPSEDIEFYYPASDSGTFDYFKEATKTRGKANNESPHRSDGTASEDDNLLVKGVEGDRNAIGYFGFAYFLNEGRNLKAVEIDGGDGCVAPTFENALAGTYKPLSRPLFIYTSEPILAEKPQALGFLDFYLDNTVQLAKEEGYISLPDDVLQEQRAKIAHLLPNAAGAAAGGGQ
jgi:phosphate transport system substrate-binding protein